MLSAQGRSALSPLMVLEPHCSLSYIFFSAFLQSAFSLMSLLLFPVCCFRHIRYESNYSITRCFCFHSRQTPGSCEVHMRNWWPAPKSIGNCSQLQHDWCTEHDTRHSARRPHFTPKSTPEFLHSWSCFFEAPRFQSSKRTLHASWAFFLEPNCLYVVWQTTLFSEGT